LAFGRRPMLDLQQLLWLVFSPFFLFPFWVAATAACYPDDSSWIMRNKLWLVLETLPNQLQLGPCSCLNCFQPDAVSSSSFDIVQLRHWVQKTARCSGTSTSSSSPAPSKCLKDMTSAQSLLIRLAPFERTDHQSRSCIT
jgi:hypothetical protein